MNSANNIIVDTLATAMIAYAIAMLAQNFWVAIVAGVLGVAGKIVYEVVLP